MSSFSQLLICGLKLRVFNSRNSAPRSFPALDHQRSWKSPPATSRAADDDRARCYTCWQHEGKAHAGEHFVNNSNRTQGAM
jgi:hypothetical protein